MNTLENNKLIAEFLGSEIYLKDTDGYSKPLSVFNSKDLIFDKDWNWLMEVVEKIESLGYDTESVYRLDDGGHCFYINDTPIFSSQMGSKIQAVYNACVEFIKYYNLQNS